MQITKRFLSALIAVLMLCGAAFYFPASAATPCLEITSSNTMPNNYGFWNWANTSDSYLTLVTDGGYMRFQANAVSGFYLIEYYDADFCLTKQLTIAVELPIFGAFYFDGGNYYVVSGQTNTEEDNSLECFRVTKYDLSWQRLASGGLSNCDTTVPFDAGCTHIAHNGGTLIIRTSHEMYTRTDGLNHQANYTIFCNTSTMKLTGTANVSYSSHSFNQLVKTEGDRVIMVDHGDAYPRALVLAVGTNSGINISNVRKVNLQALTGTTGDNYTGTYLGGMEISQNNYLTAYAMSLQDDNYQKNVTKNLYIAITNKSTLETTVKQYTDITEGETGLGTPWLVKLNDNRFAVLWQYNDRWKTNNVINYMVIDGEGNAVTEIKSVRDARLSDCQPIEVNGEAVWYFYENNTVSFCSLDALNTGKLKVTEVNTGHDFQFVSENMDATIECTIRCTHCEETKTFTIASYVMILWSFDGSSYSSANAVNGKVTLQAGHTAPLYFCNFKRREQYHDVVMTVKGDKTVYVNNGYDGYNTITFPEDGLYVITFSYKYNPNIKTTYRIKVGDDYIKAGDVNADGVIDNQDAVKILQYDAGMTESISNGDVNYDGKVDNTDATLVLKYDAGLVDDLE